MLVMMLMVVVVMAMVVKYGYAGDDYDGRGGFGDSPHDWSPQSVRSPHQCLQSQASHTHD